MTEEVRTSETSAKFYTTWRNISKTVISILVEMRNRNIMYFEGRWLVFIIQNNINIREARKTHQWAACDPRNADWKPMIYMQLLEYCDVVKLLEEKQWRISDTTKNQAANFFIHVRETHKKSRPLRKLNPLCGFWSQITYLHDRHRIHACQDEWYKDINANTINSDEIY